MSALRLYLAAVLLPAVALGVFWLVSGGPQDAPQDPRAGVTCMDEPDGAGVYCWRS